MDLLSAHNQGDPFPQNKSRILIIGGGNGGVAFIELLGDITTVDIVAVVDSNPHAPGIALAQQRGIPTARDFHAYLQDDSIDEVINVTGNVQVQDELLAARSPGVEIVGGHSAKLVWELVRKAKRERDRARTYLEAAGVMMIGLNAQEEITLANQKAQEVLGYSQEELLGKNWFDHCLPERERLAIKKVFDQLMAGEGEHVEYYQNMVLTRSGEERLIAWHNTVFRDEKGVPVGTLGSGEDVTDRIKAQNALQESKEQLDSIFGAVMDGIVVADAQTQQLSFCNQRFCEMIGYAQDEIAQLSVKDIHPPKELAYVQEKFAAQARREITLAMDLPVLRKDGTVFYADVNTQPMVIKGKQFLVGVFTDITHRREMEAALRVSEERFKIIFEYAPDAYYLSDIKGNFVDGNRAAEELTGYKREELIGKNYFSLNLLPRSQTPKAMALLAKNLAGFGAGPEDFMLRRKDGTHMYVEIRTYPTDIAGKKLILGIARDITQRKQDEDALRKNEALFRGIVKGSPIAIFTFDQNGVFTLSEGKGLNILGFMPGDVQGKPLAQVCPERKSMLDALRHSLVGQTAMITENVNGHIFHLQLSPLRDSQGRQNGVIGVATEVTELRQLEEAKRKHAFIVDNATDPMSLIDRDFVYEVVNEAFCKSHHKPASEITGKAIGALWGEETFSLIRPYLDCAFSGQEVRYQEWFTVPSSGRRYFDVSYAPYRDATGTVTSIVVVTHDITELKNAQDQVEEKMTALERFNKFVVGRELKMRELKEKIEELQEKLKKKTSDG